MCVLGTPTESGIRRMSIDSGFIAFVLSVVARCQFKAHRLLQSRGIKVARINQSRQSFPELQLSPCGQACAESQKSYGPIDSQPQYQWFVAAVNQPVVLRPWNEDRTCFSLLEHLPIFQKLLLK